MNSIHWKYLAGIAVVAIILAFLFLSFPNRTVGVPAGLAFVILANLSGATAAAVRAIGKRLDLMEQSPNRNIIPPK